MKMKAASSLSLAAVLVGGVSCQMLLEQNITEVEFAVSSMSTASGASGDESAGGATAAADLVQALEGDNQVTGEIYFGRHFFMDPNMTNSTPLEPWNISSHTY